MYFVLLTLFILAMFIVYLQLSAVVSSNRATHTVPSGQTIVLGHSRWNDLVNQTITVDITK
ncbi:exported protein of unknown function [Moritella yayanosii]|uniref:Uncharacterized protein n=1 Tax=Moritella yayanosii TaxID=69539 RepID=A0A330LP15_9GAMM|nr:exported protein of unknown function [Moritella yayanosii]